MRPFCIALIAAILGIIIGLYLKSIILFFIIIAIVSILLLFCKYNKKQIVIFSISFVLFWSYITFLENSYHEKYQEYGNKQVKIQAIIVSSKKETQYKESYQVKVTQMQNIETKQKTNKPFFMLCYIKKQNKMNLKYGDKIEFIANYELPSVARNEAGFDYRQYLKTKQIVGIANITNVKKIAEEQVNWAQTQIYSFKIGLIEKIKSILPKEEASLCIGLLLGDKSGISQEVQETFKKSSLSHMLAVSGAHVSYMLLGITSFFNIIKLQKRWSKLLLIFFLIFFMALIGFTPSVTRACIMCILTLIAEILFYKPDIYQNMSISLLIILVFNPYSILDIGLQLSFAGTLGIVLFMQKEKRTKRR